MSASFHPLSDEQWSLVLSLMDTTFWIDIVSLYLVGIIHPGANVFVHKKMAKLHKMQEEDDEDWLVD